MCITSGHSSCALQLSSVLWLSLVRNFQKSHNFQKIPSLPRSKQEAGKTLLASENYGLQKASPTWHLSPEASCTQPRTHPSSLLLKHETLVSTMFLQQGHTHNHTQLLKSAPFPPPSTFHMVCFTQIKNNPFITRQHLPKISCTTPYPCALPKITFWSLW